MSRPNDRSVPSLSPADDRLVSIAPGFWREGTPSMVPRTAATSAPHPDAVEFVRFCYHRRRVGWPELYDEMCAVAGRGLFRGFSADDLGGIGVGFSLFDMPALATLASRVVNEEAALRRPVNVVITAPTPAPAAPIAPTVAPLPSPPAAERAGDASGERSFDVPIHMALASSRA
jgi:hypothetical protein